MTDDPTRRPRQVTMADIAAHLGVSRQLVSAVLRKEPGPSQSAIKRITEAAGELGYRPHAGAVSLRRARSRDIGVVFTPTHLTEPEIVGAIYSAAGEHGYHAILSAVTPKRTTAEAVDELLSHRCAAVVIVGSNLEHGAVRAIAELAPVPVVNVSSGSRNAFYDVVRSAGDKGIAKVVQHLATLGHRHATYLDALDHRPAIPRGRGFATAAEKLGIDPDVVQWRGDYTEEAGARVAKALLKRNRLPTAVVAGNDQMAVGLMQVLMRAGVDIPGEVSVTGYDDIPMASLPGIDLTTVRQDPVAMGYTAVEAALRRIEDPEAAPTQRIFPVPLIVRGSTAAPRG